MTCGRGSPGTRSPPWSASWRRCGPGPAAPSATPPASRCASWGGARSSSTGRSSGSTSSSCPSSPPAPGPARPLRRRPGYRRAAAGRRRGPPGAAALGGRLGAPVRRRPDPRLVRQDHPPPPQPRRRPAGQPRPVAHRDHPDGHHPPTRAYVERRTAEGLSKKEIIRCLKRYVAREVYPRLRAAADWQPQTPGAA